MEVSAGTHVGDRSGPIETEAEPEQTEPRGFPTCVLARLPAVLVLPSVETAAGAAFRPVPCAIADHVEVFRWGETA